MFWRNGHLFPSVLTFPRISQHCLLTIIDGANFPWYSFLIFLSQHCVTTNPPKPGAISSKYSSSLFLFLSLFSQHPGHLDVLGTWFKGIGASNSFKTKLLHLCLPVHKKETLGYSCPTITCFRSAQILPHWWEKVILLWGTFPVQKLDVFQGLNYWLGGLDVFLLFLWVFFHNYCCLFFKLKQWIFISKALIKLWKCSHYHSMYFMAFHMCTWNLCLGL